MARSRTPIVKQSRREGYALHTKAHRYLVKKAGQQPAMGGRGRRGANTQFGIQLREKQKVKRLYGLLEKQFAKLMAEASRTKGASGATLLSLLERRLDNVVYRATFANSRRGARQLVSHGHFMVNGRRVDIPSLRVKPGDEITVRPASVDNEYFKRLDDVSPAGETPDWIVANRKKLQIQIKGVPTAEQAEPDIQISHVVEFYSR